MKLSSTLSTATKVFVMKIFQILGLSVVLIGASTPMTHAADLVTNGGFEAGNFSGWTLTGDTDFTGVDSTVPHSGTYAAYLAPDGSLGFLTQTLATLPRQTYTLSFFLQNEDGTSAGGFNEFETLVGGNALFSQTVPTQPYTKYTFDFVATGASTDLTFGFRNDLSYFDFDDVSVAPATTVPEPSNVLSTLAFSALGVACLLKRQLKVQKR